MVEFAIQNKSKGMLLFAVFTAWVYLTPDVIDACYALPLQTPEVMTQAAACPGMLVLILNHMTDVFHTMFPAPVANLPGKAFFHQSGNMIHKGIAHLGSQSLITAVAPKEWEIAVKVLAPYIT